jgi:hypothetical protein
MSTTCGVFFTVEKVHVSFSEVFCNYEKELFFLFILGPLSKCFLRGAFLLQVAAM